MKDTHETALAILAWIARIGAATGDDVAARFAITPPAARGRLSALERRGLVETHRLLHGRAALYAATRAGLAVVDLTHLKPCRVSPGGFNHLREVARAAVALERAMPGAAIVGERELRALERDAGRPLASAELGLAFDGGYVRHRPDLVVWPAGRVADADARALAIEVELTVKAARRLRAIVRGWARSRLVHGVVYYASPAAMRALRTAVAAEQAAATVHLVELARVGELPAGLTWPARSTSPVPSGA
jgi:DNA-binding MarR family transcriptional regulator